MCRCRCHSSALGLRRLAVIDGGYFTAAGVRERRWADTDLARVALCINGRSPDHVSVSMSLRRVGEVEVRD
jgi:hypothetical protein